MDYCAVKNLNYVLVGFALALLLFSPQPIGVAPALHKQVLDDQGQPASAVLTVQEWGFHGAGDGDDSRRTDEAGFVDYPQRIVRASLFSRCTALVGGLFAHGGIGPHASIWAHGSDPYVWTTHNCSIINPAPTQIRLSRQNASISPDPRHVETN